MRSIHLIPLYCFVAFVAWTGCQTPPQADNCPLCGEWDIAFHTDSIEIPARLIISVDSLFFRNGQETIVVHSDNRNLDSVHFKMPHYDSRIKINMKGKGIGGKWTNQHKADYVVPFTGTRVNGPKPADSLQAETQFECKFGEQKTIGLFRFGHRTAEGTFLTETGDYRFLEGEKTDNSFYLSCFDGSHLFYFSASIEGDSLVDGLFLSGKHHSEPWSGVKSNLTKLTDPDSLTTWVSPDEPLTLRATKMTGQPVKLGPVDFMGKVTAVTLIGTWCPNCTDLERFLLKNPILANQSDFSVLPICFESGDDSSKSIVRIQSHFQEYGDKVKPLYGGRADKQEASQVFPGLSEVTAFPTTLLIDKRGHVRHVHTGFYGPGTGAYHTLYTNRMISQIMALLSE